MKTMNKIKTPLFFTVLFVLIAFTIPTTLFAEPAVKCPCFNARTISRELAKAVRDANFLCYVDVGGDYGVARGTYAHGDGEFVYNVSGALDKWCYVQHESGEELPACEDYTLEIDSKGCLSDEEIAACMSEIDEACLGLGE